MRILFGVLVSLGLSMSAYAQSNLTVYFINWTTGTGFQNYQGSITISGWGLKTNVGGIRGSTLSFPAGHGEEIWTIPNASSTQALIQANFLPNIPPPATGTPNSSNPFVLIPPSNPYTYYLPSELANMSPSDQNTRLYFWLRPVDTRQLTCEFYYDATKIAQLGIQIQTDLYGENQCIIH